MKQQPTNSNEFCSYTSQVSQIFHRFHTSHILAFSLRCAFFRSLRLQYFTLTTYLLCVCVWDYRDPLAFARTKIPKNAIVDDNKISAKQQYHSNLTQNLFRSCEQFIPRGKVWAHSRLLLAGAAAASRSAGRGAAGLPARRRRRQVRRSGGGGGGVRRPGGGAPPGPPGGPGRHRRLPRRAGRLPRACGCWCALGTSSVCQNRMPLR